MWNFLLIIWMEFARERRGAQSLLIAQTWTHFCPRVWEGTKVKNQDSFPIVHSKRTQNTLTLACADGCRQTQARESPLSEFQHGGRGQSQTLNIVGSPPKSEQNSGIGFLTYAHANYLRYIPSSNPPSLLLLLRRTRTFPRHRNDLRPKNNFESRAHAWTRREEGRKGGRKEGETVHVI